ncbi:MAG: DNA recombination protein RmuC [Pseudomonadota bacterium]|nr:DNA recombination protein RmuC [Pseudomonadota bacterium]HJO35249.1 DNA recombination protein RmuC [Gammaproteobacteria bacterium]
MTVELLVGVLAGLALGALIGWLAWSRPAAQAQTGFARERQEHERALTAAQEALTAAQRALEEERGAHARTREIGAGHSREHAVAVNRVESAEQRIQALDAQCRRLEEKIATLEPYRVELAELQSTLRERDEAHAQRARELEERFATLASAALERSQQALVASAAETLKLHRAEAEGGLQKNREALGKLIEPMRDTLSRYERQLREIETARHTAYGAITNAIDEVKAGQKLVADEAQRIVHSLRNAPKVRGRWGEHQLRRVLEMAGLSPHCDFAEEVSRESADGRLRPDVVINLPNDRVLVVDAKCSLNAYQDAVGAETDEERRTHMLAHAKALRAHVESLGRKSYAQQFEDTLDFVIMFVPGENFLAAALEVDQDLFDVAFERRVLLASPTNLIAIARTVAMVWQQERAADDARRIAALGKELYDRLATLGEHVARLGKSLDQATGHYNRLVGSLESQVMTSAQRFRDLAIDPPKKPIEPLVPVTTEPRVLTKLDPGAASR